MSKYYIIFNDFGHIQCTSFKQRVRYTHGPSNIQNLPSRDYYSTIKITHTWVRHIETREFFSKKKKNCLTVIVLWRELRPLRVHQLFLVLEINFHCKHRFLRELSVKHKNLFGRFVNIPSNTMGVLLVHFMDIRATYRNNTIFWWSTLIWNPPNLFCRYTDARKPYYYYPLGSLSFESPEIKKELFVPIRLLRAILRRFFCVRSV